MIEAHMEMDSMSLNDLLSIHIGHIAWASAKPLLFGGCLLHSITQTILTDTAAKDYIDPDLFAIVDEFSPLPGPHSCQIGTYIFNQNLKP